MNNMDFQLIQSNIVVLANKHNPSIISKEWLSRNDIIEENIINFTHMPVASLVETTNYNLVVDQNRLQLSVKNLTPDTLKLLPQFIMKYMEKLPETPYIAIGYNYSYDIKLEQKLLKELLKLNDRKLTETFSEGYNIGMIVKFHFNNFNATLTLNPINSVKIIGDFNFQFESSSRNEMINKLFDHFETKQKTEEILRGLSSA
ncbi:hypothetical protein MYX76_16310 [Desulfobacterota bacterium AH_259_B03_O07]|nr:hypothetical protein [Desulfobacterota bacterium AH_259_B03_O07]